MCLQTIQGVIRRRILVNFRTDPEIIRRHLPTQFRPKLHGDSAIVGICLIRLEQMRPKVLPVFLGMASENAAHRIAVVWNDAAGEAREGVFVVRRDTNSTLNTLAGGRLFPGDYHPANFEVMDFAGKIAFQMRSRDGEVKIRLRAEPAKQLPAGSHFPTLRAASDFFEPGSLGYSASRGGNRLNGMILKTQTWQLEPLEVAEVDSSYFSDAEKFPAGSICFDCALLMRDIAHEWRNAPDLDV